ISKIEIFESKYSPTPWIVQINYRQVKKSVVSTAYDIITDQAITTTKFQVRNGFKKRLPKLLVGHLPGQSGRGEKTKASVCMESFGAVVAKIEFGKIAFIKRVGHPSGKSKVSSWQ